MPYVDNDGAHVYYETHGSGPAVLFVHGSGGHHAAWWQQVAALADDYTVITVDLRGFGNTRWTEEHDARNFPGVILAHSLGGLRHSELTDLVKADRAVAEKIPVLDRLMTPEFRARRPDMA